MARSFLFIIQLSCEGCRCERGDLLAARLLLRKDGPF